MKYTLTIIVAALCLSTSAQNIFNNPTSNHGNRFEQLGTILPTPNEYRTASGAPGTKYWQQRCDYNIVCQLDEPNLSLIGSETVTYFNNSPDVLKYIWLQLDENEHSTINNANYQASSTANTAMDMAAIDKMIDKKTDNGLGIKISLLTDALGKKLAYTINKTMMRVDLPMPLKPGQSFIFKCNWTYKIPDRMTLGGRGGLEFFPEDGNHLFTISQWFPRLCVYSDYQGWQNGQFSGASEFALTFGNYKVAITVPADHIVMATGECVNYAKVLSPVQMQRYTKATTAKEPIEIVTLEEAKKAEQQKSTLKKTWNFSANMVRDFAFGSSRKFCWDAMATKVEGKRVMCMSAYPKESYNLYKKYSTKVVAHTIKTYSKFTIPYPYPVAQSIEAASGMEYPMICFNYGRTEKDGTYTEATKNGMIGVITHEVGHNFFPMIINSDERQWGWMDEGLNSFVEYLTEELWDNKFPTRRGPTWGIIDYMKLPKTQLEPIMTNAENLISLGNNAYAKPSCGLNILRETVIGRDLFDFAFREYSRRWAFKHPTPADLFRTMEDATAEDLDWFWRGWFYGIEPCDIAIDTVKAMVYDGIIDATNNKSSQVIKVGMIKPSVNAVDDISKIRNRNDKNISFATDADTSLQDFYWKYDRGIIAFDTTIKTDVTIATGYENLSEADKTKCNNIHLYEITFNNKGGLVMPIIVEFTFEDGSKQLERIPAQIWRKNESKVVKTFMTNKKAINIILDPLKETADIDDSNNKWPKLTEAPSKFTIFKNKITARGQSTGSNNMQIYNNKK
jgi:Peptidase family M1 domain